MKFGHNYTQLQIPEWKVKYLDYKGLKQKIKAIRSGESPLEEFIQFFQEEREKISEFHESNLSKYAVRNGLLHSQVEKLHTIGDGQKKKCLLLKAYQEHYRALNLLKKFAQLNDVAIHKILKKAFKKIGASIRVDKLNCQILNFLLSQSEYVVINEFADGNRKQGMKLIRFVSEKFYNFAVVYRCGLWSGMGIMLLAIILTLYGLWHSIRPSMNDELYVFKIMLFPIILLLLIAWNLRIWWKNTINWRFIFGLSARPQDHMTKWEFTEISLISLVIWEVGAIILLVLLRLDVVYRWAVSIIIATIFIGVMICPFHTFYFDSRRWFIRSLLRVGGAPFFPVLFQDFWIADQLTSMSEFLFEIQFAFCFYGLENDPFCREIQTLGLPILTMIPWYIRMMQCLRRFYDDRDTNHLLNAFKYFISGVTIIIAFVDSILLKTYGVWNWGKYTWIIMNSIATIYRYVWDVYIDWGLWRGGRNHFLRKELIFKKRWYFVAMILNIVLRLTWVILLVVNIMISANTTVKFWITIFFGGLELFRRFIWNVFRVENEHLNNCENYRVVRDVPLPFEEVSEKQIAAI